MAANDPPYLQTLETGIVMGAISPAWGTSQCFFSSLFHPREHVAKSLLSTLFIESSLLKNITLRPCKTRLAGHGPPDRDPALCYFCISFIYQQKSLAWLTSVPTACGLRVVVVVKLNMDRSSDRWNWRLHNISSWSQLLTQKTVDKNITIN